MLLLLLSSDPLKISGEYYVSIDSIEQTDENQYQLIFDGVNIKHFNEFENTNIREMYEKTIPHIIVVNIDQRFLNSFYSSLRSRKLTGKWFILKTTKYTTTLSASLSIENSEFPESVKTFIYSIEFITPQQEAFKKIHQFFSWSHFDRGNTKGIENHLLNISSNEPFHTLNVYNVGQGSLTAVTDQNNTPLFYYDIGGAWWIFPNSYPRTLRLCFCKTKTVIISHWDLDHIETARRLFYSNPEQLEGITWIAPKQTLTTTYLRLAARMADTGTLLLWSGNYIEEINFWAGQLLKCNGPEKNHNGIALVVNSPDNDIKAVLHPGDAAYTYIPLLQNLKLDGMVATHHGANFDFNNAPIPMSTDGAIAYSHDNRYGHPTPDSIQAHMNSGWTNRRDTTSGNISFNFIMGNNINNCGGNHPDLDIAQTF